jgi:hypothetical protein
MHSFMGSTTIRLVCAALAVLFCVVIMLRRRHKAE